ncbi:glycosyltransferase [Parashewanella tropica]|uniref:glycosyltransferase n=1 Tax=Parashewanella tropica TaxID=2547970 RepID=UPI00105A8D20|nr:glycosyltransferase [Parashewanella tropica]
MPNINYFFYDAYHCDYAGAQKSMVLLANSLSRSGENVSCMTVMGSNIDLHLEPSITRCYLPQFFYKIAKPRILNILFSVLFSFCFFFKQKNKNTIFIGNEELGFLSLLPLRLFLAKVIWYVRSSDKLGFMDNFMFYSSSHVFSMTKSMLEERFTRLDSSKVSILSSVFTPPINMNEEQLLADKFVFKDKLCFGVFGAIVPRKNIIEAIDGFVSADLNDSVLIIVGPKVSGFEYYFNSIVTYIDELSLFDKVFVLENYSSIYSLYSKVDVLLLTSIDEGIPRVILEGLYFDKPVISSNVGGIKEAFSEFISIGMLKLYNKHNISKLSELISESKAMKRCKTKNLVLQVFCEKKHRELFLLGIKKL